MGIVDIVHIASKAGSKGTLNRMVSAVADQEIASKVLGKFKEKVQLAATIFTQNEMKRREVSILVEEVSPTTNSTNENSEAGIKDLKKSQQNKSEQKILHAARNTNSGRSDIQNEAKDPLTKKKTVPPLQQNIPVLSDGDHIIFSRAGLYSFYPLRLWHTQHAIYVETTSPPKNPAPPDHGVTVLANNSTCGANGDIVYYKSSREGTTGYTEAQLIYEPLRDYLKGHESTKVSISVRKPHWVWITNTLTFNGQAVVDRALRAMLVQNEEQECSSPGSYQDAEEFVNWCKYGVRSPYNIKHAILHTAIGTASILHGYFMVPPYAASVMLSFSLSQQNPIILVPVIISALPIYLIYSNLLTHIGEAQQDSRKNVLNFKVRAGFLFLIFGYVMAVYFGGERLKRTYRKFILAEEYAEEFKKGFRALEGSLLSPLQYGSKKTKELYSAIKKSIYK